MMALISQEHKHVKIQLPFCSFGDKWGFLGVVWSIRPHWAIGFTEEEHKIFQINDSEDGNSF